MRRAKRNAATEGKSLTELIEAGLRQMVREPPPKPTRVLPPVSSASGGLMPGIDLNDSAALQEAEDIETARRLR
ncbi:MAG TPA: hypothetical protein VHY79_10160 [Rhizomicrobium sp.]|nr:hypothetical protein [Rhizomicrobium sp.]